MIKIPDINKLKDNCNYPYTEIKDNIIKVDLGDNEYIYFSKPDGVFGVSDDGFWNDEKTLNYIKKNISALLPFIESSDK